MKSWKVIVPSSEMCDVVLGETPTEAVENWFQVNKDKIRNAVLERDESFDEV